MPRQTPQFDPEEVEWLAETGVSSPSCPPLDMLLAAGQDVLPSDVDLQVQRHAEQCSLCKGVLADMATLQEAPLSAEQLERMAVKLPPMAASRPVARAVRWPAYAAAAAVLLLLASWGFAHSRAHQPAGPGPQIVTTPVATPPTVQMASLQIPRDALAPPGPEATGLLTRGSSSGVNPSTEELLPAFQAYNAGDYGRAVQLFQPLKRAYPKGDIVPLYLGVSQVMLRDDGDAFATLTAVERRAKPARKDAVLWYTAVAAQGSHPDEAKRILTELCAKGHSAYADQSCRLMTALSH